MEAGAGLEQEEGLLTVLAAAGELEDVGLFFCFLEGVVVEGGVSGRGRRGEAAAARRVGAAAEPYVLELTFELRS